MFSEEICKCEISRIVLFPKKFVLILQFLLTLSNVEVIVEQIHSLEDTKNLSDYSSELIGQFLNHRNQES